MGACLEIGPAGRTRGRRQKVLAIIALGGLLASWPAGALHAREDLMAFEDIMSVPGQLTEREVRRILYLAGSVPQGGTIIETGSLYGRSTLAWSEGAPRAVVFAIDPWEPAQWITDWVQGPLNAPPFSQEAFQNYTRKSKNIIAIRGYSPDCVSHWVDPIDIYFDDAVHEDPGFSKNVDFWLQFLKPGGIFCGHDFRYNYTDITRRALETASAWGTDLNITDNLFWIRKPG